MKLKWILCAITFAVGLAATADADEIWVAPTSQGDVGGLNIASNVVWPVTPIGAVRLAWGVPGDLLTFQSAKVVLIPHGPGGAATLNVIICGAQNGTGAAASCAGPFPQAFTGVANQLREVDISTIVGPRIGTPGLNHLAILAYTAPTTTTDHIVGLRFVYAPTAPTITGTMTINSGNLDLDTSTVAVGNLTKNGARFLHNFGSNNTFLGATAGNFAMTGGEATAVGAQALSSNTTGNYNTAHGTRALRANTSGSSNTGLGADALADNTIGGGNTAVGSAALTSNETGESNTAVGGSALGGNRTGDGNTAIGANTLVFNLSNNNTAVGADALFSNFGGSENTALGRSALSSNTAGFNNVAVGYRALADSTTGDQNTAFGADALRRNTAGDQNVAVGDSALLVNLTGVRNVAVGFGAGSFATGSDNIYLGDSVTGVGGESKTMRLGRVGTQTKTIIAGVRGTTTLNANAVPVLIDSAGQLGTTSSSRRHKEDIRDLADRSRRLFDLRPVAFQYKQAFADGTKPTQFGLIAEEVAEVFPELAVRGADGEVETVHYETLSVLLLNELQRQERLHQQQERVNLQQQERLAALERRVSGGPSSR